MPSGNFNFPATLTGNPQSQAGTGLGFATFLLGAVGSANATSHLPEDHTAYSISGFVQDDWKIGRRLTVNLGVRYDYQAPPEERDCATSNFNPFETNPQNGLLGRMEFACVDYGGHLPRARHQRRRRRASASPTTCSARAAPWSAAATGCSTRRTSIATTSARPMASPTRTTQYNPPGGNANLAAFQLQDGFPTPVIQPLGSALGPSAFLGGAVSYDEANGKNIASHQWTLSMQQQVPGEVVLEAGVHAPIGRRTSSRGITT